MIGMGDSDSENRAIEAVERALNNPLLDLDINGAKGALINVSGGVDITIRECQKIVETIATRLAPDAQIIWGAQIVKELGDSIRTMLIVTGANSPSILMPQKVYTKEKKREAAGFEEAHQTDYDYLTDIPELFENDIENVYFQFVYLCHDHL